MQTAETQRTQRLRRESDYQKLNEKLKDERTLHISHHVNFLTSQIISSAIEVHRALGPGLLESAYRESLARELFLRRFSIKTKWPVPLEYKGMRVDKAYEAELIVEDKVVVETKAVEALHPVHEARLLTYLRLGRWKVGLLINFDIPVLKDGIRRRVLGLEE